MSVRYEINDTVQGTLTQGSDALLKVGRTSGGGGLTVTVKDLSGNNLIVYQAETGATTIANPLTSDVDTGRVEGWVEAPDFDLQISGTGITTYTQKVRFSAPGEFNVKSYGCVGNGSNDDTAGFQAAIDAACTANGCLVIAPPQVGQGYVISDTLMIEPKDGSGQVHMDILASGPWYQISWTGADNTPIFESFGWKRGRVEGVKIHVSGNNNDGVTAWEVNIRAADSSSGAMRWADCHVLSSGTGNTDCTGWRLGHGYSGGELSFHYWEDCYVSWNASAAAGNVGWRNEHNNSTHHTLLNCAGSSLDSFFSNRTVVGAAQHPGLGAGAWTFIGCGGSFTYGPTYEAYVCPLVIQGGRWELGTQFLITSNSAGKLSSVYVIEGVMIDDFDPPADVLFDIKGSHHVTLTGVRAAQQSGGAYTTHTAAMFTLQNDGAADNLAAGALIVRGCEFQAADPFYTIADGNWRVISEGNTVIGADGQSSDFFHETASVTAAANITLAPHAKVVTVNGNTNITSITADKADKGRTVTLIFTGTPTLTDGSNLKLGANFVATADDAITLACDGTNWYGTGPGSAN